MDRQHADRVRRDHRLVPRFRRVGLWLVLGGSLIASPSFVGAEAVIGQPAPAFTLTDTTGHARSLADWHGNIVVLEWFNNDCPFVGKHYGSGNMQQMQADYTAKGVVWLSVVSSAAGKQGHISPEEGNEIMKQRQSHQTAMLLDSDGVVGRSYGAKTTPHLFIISPDGALIYAGGVDNIASTDQADVPNATNFVRHALDEVLAGQPVSVSESKPYGCSVKY